MTKHGRRSIRTPTALELHRHGALAYPGLWRSLTQTLSLLARDVVRGISTLVRSPAPVRRGRFAFVAHPRDTREVYRRYPALRFLGSRVTELVVLLMPPVRMGEIWVDGQLRGEVWIAAFTPRMLRRWPKFCAYKTLVACHFAEKRGHAVLGLGGLNPMLTRYGQHAQSAMKRGRVTTGHAYAAYTMAAQLQHLADLRGLDLAEACVAVCGSAGSTGMAAVRTMLARLNGRLGELLLIDIREQRNHAFAREVRGAYPQLQTVTSNTLMDARRAQLVIVATAAEEALVEPDMIAPGTLVIDDSHPRNTRPDVCSAEQGTWVIDVLSSIPKLHVDADLGLLPERPEITFTCLAEAYVLAEAERLDLCVTGHVSADAACAIGDLAETLGVRPSALTSFYRELDPEQVAALPASAATFVQPAALGAYANAAMDAPHGVALAEQVSVSQA